MNKIIYEVHRFQHVNDLPLKVHYYLYESPTPTNFYNPLNGKYYKLCNSIFSLKNTNCDLTNIHPFQPRQGCICQLPDVPTYLFKKHRFIKDEDLETWVLTETKKQNFIDE